MAKFIAIEQVAIKNMSNWNAEIPELLLFALLSFGALFAGMMTKSIDICLSAAMQLMGTRESI